VKEVAAANLQCHSLGHELPPMKTRDRLLSEHHSCGLVLPSSRPQTPNGSQKEMQRLLWSGSRPQTPTASQQEIGQRTLRALLMSTTSLRSGGIVGSTPPSPSMLAVLSASTCHGHDTAVDFSGELPQTLAGESPVRPRLEPYIADSLGEGLEDECEDENIATIQHHLEEMNVAAIELNSAQEAVSSQSEERQRLVQLWAVGSARLVRAIGAHRLAKATPYHECARRCEAAQRAVQEASAQYMAAFSADLTASEMDAITRVHASKLEEFQAVQRELHRLRAGRSYSKSSVAAAAPFFEAEEEHRAQLSHVDTEISLLKSEVDTAKTRYHAALRGLEALSEQAHRHRGAVMLEDSSLGGGGGPAERSCNGASSAALAKDCAADADGGSTMILTHASLPLLSPDITPGRTMRRKSADERGVLSSPIAPRRRGRAATMGARASSGRRRRKQTLVTTISDGSGSVFDERPRAAS